MSSSSALQIKCYLLKDNSKLTLKAIDKAIEIRRFNLVNDENVYKNLIEKILQHFKDFFQKKDEIKSYWLDDENEFIGFSSDAELQYAIDIHTALRLSKPLVYNNASSSIFKVYIVKTSNDEHISGASAEHTSGASASGSDGGVFNTHYGVTCDGCNMSPIVGIRFKCTECADYDLCSTCESNGVHNEHKFMKMEFPKFFHRAFKCHQRGFGSGRHHHHNHHHQQQHQQQHYQQHCRQAYDAAANIFTQIPFVNDPEQLKKFGEHFKNILEPFGIDVDYYVDTLTKPSTADEKKSAEEKPVGESQQTSEVKNDEQMDSNTSTTSSTSSISITKIEPQPQQVEAVATASAPTPTLVAEKPTKPTEDEGFNFVDFEKELPVINEESNQVKRAIDLLKAMGFKDENGWLTALVKAKNGDLNSVLDAIKWSDIPKSK